MGEKTERAHQGAARRTTRTVTVSDFSDVWGVFLHPLLWPEGIRAVFRVARRGWWKRWPFLPLPDVAYLAWRRQTAYGGKKGEVPSTVTAQQRRDDLVSWLRYCRGLRRCG